MAKRILGILVAVLLAAALLPVGVLAESTRDAALDNALNVEGGSIQFESEGVYAWTAVSSDEEGHSSYGKCGNTGTPSSTSTLTASVTVGEGGAGLTFDFMACGESSNYGYVFDHCIFKIDGAEEFNKGAEYDAGWQSWAVNLEEGAHTLVWSYTKDGSVNGTGDYFAVDNVALGDLIPDDPDPDPEPEPEPVVPTDEELDDALNAEGGSIHFVNDETYPWTVIDDGERYYAKSGNAGVTSSTSTVTANVTVEAEGMMVRFDLIARGEGYDTVDWDTCRLFVDGEMVMKYGSHDEVWESFEYALEPGDHVLEWQYKKDHSTNPAGDYFAVDNVEIIEGTPFVPETIDVVEILGFSSPLWGQHPNYDVTVPDDANYHIDTIMWQYADPDNEDYGQLYEDEYFDNEYATYNLLVRIYPNEGYVISDDAAALIDGSTVAVGSYGNSIFGYFYIYSREYEVDPSVVNPTPVPEEPVGPVWDFENDPENQGWTFVDGDGDGFNWEWMVDWYGDYYFHEGYGFLHSASYDNSEGIALEPDNWAITPEFEVPEDGIFSFWAQGQDPDWPYEIFGIYLRTSPDADWIQIGEDDFTWWADLQYQYDISAYAGQTVQMAIRHYNVTDMFELNVDYVEITSGTITPPSTNYIEEVCVEGYEPPVAGEDSADHLVFTVPDGAHYRIVPDMVEWWDNTPEVDDVFEGVFVLGTSYSVGMILCADEGYVFSPNCVFRLNGSEELVDMTYSGVETENNSYAYLWSVPTEATEPGGDVITDVYIYGFDYPYAGEETYMHNYVDTNCSEHYCVTAAYWYDDTNGEVFEGEFVLGNYYSMGVSLETNGGYVFSPDVNIHFVDNEVDVDWDNTEVWNNGLYLDIFTVSVECVEAPELIAIHEIWIDGFGEPVEGIAGIDHVFLTSPDDAPYFVVYGGWRDETDQQQMWSEEHVFIAGHLYSEGALIMAEDGYYFADDCVFYANGGTEIIDTEWTYVDTEDNIFAYINTIPVMCGGEDVPVWGDSDGNGEVTLADVLLIIRYAQDLIDENALDLELSDVNGDGAVNLVDALLVLRYYLGLIESLPV